MVPIRAWRIFLVSAIVLAASAALPQTAAAAWAPDAAAARTFAASRPGNVSFLIRDLETGRSWGLDSWRQVQGASLLKTVLTATYLRSPAVRSRPLRASDRALLSPMIRSSANAPASTIVVRHGAESIARTGRALGISVRIKHPWGATLTSARQQVALFTRLESRLPERHRGYAMDLLRRVVPPQRWGVMDVPLPSGWRIAAKGGWGSGSGAVDHQTALLERGDQRIVLAITTTGNGSHARGKATLRGVAHRLLRNLPSD